MIILAVTGLIGSGKDSVAGYLEGRYGFHLIDYSQVVGEMLTARGLSHDRDYKRNLRKEHGHRFLAEEVVKRLKAGNWEYVVLSALRRPEDYTVVKDAFPQSRLLVIEATSKMRYEHTKKRTRDTPLSWEHFLEEDKKEEEIFQFTKTFQLRDYTISNNSTLEELHQQVDVIVQTLGDTN